MTIFLRSRFYQLLTKNISRLGFQNWSCICKTSPKLFF